MTPARGMIVAALVALAGCRDRSAAGESAIGPAPAGLISDAMVAQVIERAPIEQYFGVAMNGKKIGWTRIALRRAAPGEPGGIVTETELALHHRKGAPTTSLELRFYAASAPYRLVALDPGGAGTGRQPARSAESLHGVVAQLYAEPAWLVPGRSQTFPSYDTDLGRDDSDTVRVAEVTRQRIAGVDTDVAVIESQSDGESAVSRIHLGRGGIALRADHGTFALELQSRAQAQSDVVGFDMVDDAVPVDRPIGDAAALSRLELIVGVSSGFVVPESPRQQVERLGDGRYRVVLTRGPGQPVTPEDRRDALAFTPTVDAGDPDIQRLAAEITRDIATDRDKVAALVGWVFASVRKQVPTNLETASQVEAERAGDCTEHTLLLLALARAARIPAREVSGLVYMGDDHQRFGYHAWAEVDLGGVWMPVDPSFGQPFADPTHLTFGTGSDSSWVMTMGAITIWAP